MEHATVALLTSTLLLHMRIRKNGSGENPSMRISIQWPVRCDKNRFELIHVIGDSITWGALLLYLERMKASEQFPVAACWYCGSYISVPKFECFACGYWHLIDPTCLG